METRKQLTAVIVELGPLLQHVTIDLQAVYEIYAIVIWHYHKQAQVYYDVVVQVANDPNFKTYCPDPFQ